MYFKLLKIFSTLKMAVTFMRMCVGALNFEQIYLLPAGSVLKIENTYICLRRWQTLI